MTDSPYLQIEEKAPSGWNMEFLRRANEMFPTLKGAKVADILDILDNSDWDIGAVEALMDFYKWEFLDFSVYSVRIAVMYAKVAAIDTRAVVYALATPKER